jgi:hypothetical protein
MLNSTKFEDNWQVSASNFVVFDALDINAVFFNTVPEAALIDPQKFGGSDLHTACFSQGFNDHAFFDFIEAFIQWQVTWTPERPRSTRDQEGGPLQGPLKGEYDPNAIHFLAVNLIWKF